MTFGGFPKETVKFLAALAKNNDKSWFDAHRQDYESYYVAPALAFVTAMAPKLEALDPAVQIEPRVGGSVMRIFRDVRFSKDKTPYKDYLDIWCWSGDKKGWDSSGFFFRLTASELMLGTGLHCFTPPVLPRYRAAVLDDAKGEALVKLTGKLRKAGYVVGNEGYKKPPKGVAPDHPRVSLLKHDGLHASWGGKHPSELFGPDFVRFASKHLGAVAPLHAWIRAM
jgi:uncharacterized protein (TIGR02453 family)